MLDHFCAKGPKFWWVATSGLTHVLDHKNLTKDQKVLFELDFDAYLFLMDALSFELFYKVNHKGIAHELWKSIKHTSVTPPHGMMASSRRRMSLRWRHVIVLSITTIW
jgi:hypothetical protein